MCYILHFRKPRRRNSSPSLCPWKKRACPPEECIYNRGTIIKQFTDMPSSNYTEFLKTRNGTYYINIVDFNNEMTTTCKINRACNKVLGCIMEDIS